MENNTAIVEEAARLAQIQEDLISGQADLLFEQAREITELENREPEVITETVTNTETVEVEVDNGNLDMVLEHIFDNDGDIEYLTYDLDDDEVDEIVDRIQFVNDAKQTAMDAVRDELFDELEDEYEFDEDDLRRLKINNDDDDLIVGDVDFEDSDVEIFVSGTFRDDSDRYYFEAKVEIEDGEFDRLRILNVWEYR